MVVFISFEDIVLTAAYVDYTFAEDLKGAFLHRVCFFHEYVREQSNA